MPSEAAEIAVMSDRLRAGEHLAESAGATVVALVERARAGDADAFDELMLLHQRRVYATAWRLLGNAEDARDATQEAFLRAFRYLKRFDARQDFGAWLYRIVINVCRTLGRKRGAALESFEERQAAGGLDHLSSGEDVEGDAIRAQQQAWLRRALDGLTKREREAIVLRDFEGFSTADVARLLGTSETTVRSQISMARAKLKRFCERLPRSEQREVKR